MTPSGTLTVYAATYPYTMDAVMRGTVTVTGEEASIQVTWLDNPHTGGSAVTGYHLQHNSGYLSSFIEPGVDIPYGTNTYTLENVIAGVTYAFRITAYNPWNPGLHISESVFIDNQSVFDVIVDVLIESSVSIKEKRSK